MPQKPAAVRRCEIVLRLREAELREATTQLMRREGHSAAFAYEEVEIARAAVERARANRDLAALDLEEARSAEGGGK